MTAPPLLFALLCRPQPGFRAFALGIDLRWLTATQARRVIGVMFLAFYAFGLLPGLFAWPAGLGDAAVGVAVPFVLLAILRSGRLATSGVLAQHRRPDRLRRRHRHRRASVT